MPGRSSLAGEAHADRVGVTIPEVVFGRSARGQGAVAGQRLFCGLTEPLAGSQLVAQSPFAVNLANLFAAEPLEQLVFGAPRVVLRSCRRSQRL